MSPSDVCLCNLKLLLLTISTKRCIIFVLVVNLSDNNGGEPSLCRVQYANSVVFVLCVSY